MRICIIGGGIVGLNIAYTLSQTNKDEIYLFEKEQFLGHHASSRNSEVIHAGFAYPPGSLKAKLCIEGMRLTYENLAILNVPHKKCGKWIIAADADELEALDNIMKNAMDSGAEGIHPESVEKALWSEPSLKDLKGVLFSSNSGIMDTAAYIKELEVSLSNSKNTNLVFPCKVTGIDHDRLQTDRGEMEYDIAINSAGLFSDDIYKAAGGKRNLQIRPFKGEYYIWRGGDVRSLIYPVPRRFIKKFSDDPTKTGNFGIHLHRSFAGDVLLGPSIVELKPEQKTDYSITTPPEIFAESVSHYIKNIKAESLLPAQAGNRAKLFEDGRSVPDFLIFREGNIIHLLGIESPGLTAAPAIARYVVEMI